MVLHPSPSQLCSYVIDLFWPGRIYSLMDESRILLILAGQVLVEVVAGKLHALTVVKCLGCTSNLTS